MTCDMNKSNRAKNAYFSCCGRDGAASAGTGSGRSRALVLLTLLACGVLSWGDLACAKDAKESGTAAVALDQTNQDLLLFWEEKELYVQTATRTAKPISQVAENMEVVTSKEIQEMGAHNVAEVLRRVPGLFVDFNTVNDFGTTSNLSIQGSHLSHVTVLLDGIVWNSLNSGSAEVASIPVGIIDRIEIIKGAASSAWGSALGGVINIITKNAGDSARPKGMVSASYGEGNSRDYSGEMSGKGGPVGYYLHADRQDSDGLLNNRAYSRDGFFGKFTATPVHNLDLTFTTGYSDPEFNAGFVPVPQGAATGLNPQAKVNTFFASGAFDYRIAPELSIKGGGYSLDQKTDTGSFREPAHTLRRWFIYDEHTVAGNLRLVYTGAMHTAVLGAELSYGSLDQISILGPTAAPVPNSSMMNKWAIFGNDTIVINKLAITPGIRFDHVNLSGSFISPSLGATYEFGEHVIARASGARGFSSPSLSALTGGGFLTVPNGSLSAEYGWSYQAGLESALMDYLNLKGTLFRHDISHEIVPDSTNTYHNSGAGVRQGYELQVECAPIYNFSLKAAHSFVHIKDSALTPTKSVNYSYQVGIKYDDRKSVSGQLAGTYIWWDLPGSSAPGAKYDSFIWDLNLNKKFHVSEATSVDAFLNVHNLFNGSLYTLYAYPNPSRWFEGGLRFNF